MVNSELDKMLKSKAIEDMTFEESLKELEQIVKVIDSGQEDLQKMISAFERGSELRDYCYKQIQEAKMKVKKIVQDTDGNIESAEADL